MITQSTTLTMTQRQNSRTLNLAALLVITVLTTAVGCVFLIVPGLFMRKPRLRLRLIEIAAAGTLAGAIEPVNLIAAP